MEKPKVMIVEDDPIVASDIKHKVRDFGYDVCAMAVAGEQAVENAKKHQPDVVLMDITLEGKMDGVQAADAIRKSLAIPVVFLTAHSDQATVQRAKLTLPYGYVLKPIREIELRIALEMAVYTGKRGREQKESEKDSSSGTRREPPPTGLNDAERAEIQRLLGKIDPFNKVPAELLQEISGQCSLHEYRPLEIISMEGESDSSNGFLVLSGRVALLKTSLNGRELVVQLVGPDSTFGLLASLDANTEELTARAQVESKLLHVPKTSVLYLLSEQPSLYPDFLAELSRRMNALHNMARSLAHDKVDVRIAATLATLLDGEEEGGKNGSAAEIKMSRQELANLAGTTVETAIRITRNLEKSGILELPDHRVIRILKPEKLKSLAEDAGF